MRESADSRLRERRDLFYLMGSGFAHGGPMSERSQYARCTICCSFFSTYDYGIFSHWTALVMHYHSWMISIFKKTRNTQLVWINRSKYLFNASDAISIENFRYKGNCDSNVIGKYFTIDMRRSFVWFYMIELHTWAPKHPHHHTINVIGDKSPNLFWNKSHFYRNAHFHIALWMLSVVVSPRLYISNSSLALGHGSGFSRLMQTINEYARVRISYSVVLHNINPFRITCLNSLFFFICAHNYRTQYTRHSRLVLRVTGGWCVFVCVRLCIRYFLFHTLFVHII